MFSKSLFQIINGEKLFMLEGHGSYEERELIRYVSVSNDQDAETIRIETKFSRSRADVISFQLWNTPNDGVLGVYTDTKDNDYYIIEASLANAYRDGSLIGIELMFIMKGIQGSINDSIVTAVTISDFFDNGNIERKREIIIAKNGEFLKSVDTIDVGKMKNHWYKRILKAHKYNPIKFNMSARLFFGPSKYEMETYRYDKKEQMYHFLRQNYPTYIIKKWYNDPESGELKTELRYVEPLPIDKEEIVK